MLDRLWQLLAAAEESGAPEGCSCLIYVPFNLDTKWFKNEFGFRIRGYYRPVEGEVIEPFGTIDRVLEDLPRAQIKRHHLSCCGVEVPGVPNSVLSLWYAIDKKRYWVALPGITYATNDSRSHFPGRAA